MSARQVNGAFFVLRLAAAFLKARAVDCRKANLAERTPRPGKEAGRCVVYRLANEGWPTVGLQATSFQALGPGKMGTLLYKPCCVNPAWAQGNILALHTADCRALRSLNLMPWGLDIGALVAMVFFHARGNLEVEKRVVMAKVPATERATRVGLYVAKRRIVLDSRVKHGSCECQHVFPSSKNSPSQVLELPIVISANADNCVWALGLSPDHDVACSDRTVSSRRSSILAMDGFHSQSSGCARETAVCALRSACLARSSANWEK